MTIVSTVGTAAGQSNNPLLQDWNTPHQTPPFSRIRNEHYAPAVREAIKEAEKNIRRIVNQKEARPSRTQLWPCRRPAKNWTSSQG